MKIWRTWTDVSKYCYIFTTKTKISCSLLQLIQLKNDWIKQNAQMFCFCFCILSWFLWLRFRQLQYDCKLNQRWQHSNRTADITWRIEKHYSNAVNESLSRENTGILRESNFNLKNFCIIVCIFTIILKIFWIFFKFMFFYFIANVIAFNNETVAHKIYTVCNYNRWMACCVVLFFQCQWCFYIPNLPCRQVLCKHFVH